jgi:hypothetical protein
MSICSVEGCEKESKTKSYCQMHYARYLRTGVLGSPESMRNKNVNLKCSVDGCERKVKAKTLCDMHLARVYRTGEVGSASPLKYNTTKEIREFPKVKKFLVTKCRAANCNENSIGMGFCKKHYEEFGFGKKGKLK